MTTQINQLLPKVFQGGGELELRPETAATKFTPKELEIVKASLRSERNFLVKEMGAQAVVALAHKIRKEVVMRLGINAGSGEEEAEIIQYIGKAIVKHSALTYREIIFAVDKALDGEYLRDGQTFVHFSLANFSLWLKAYLNETKSPVMTKVANAKHGEKQEMPAPPEEAQRVTTINLVNMFLDQRKNDETSRVSGAASLYDDLGRFGIYQATPVEKVEAEILLRKIHPALRDSAVFENYTKTELYNRYIDSLLLFENRLGLDGKVMPDPEPAQQNQEEGSH